MGGDFNTMITYGDELKPDYKSKDIEIHNRLNNGLGLINCWKTANSAKTVPTTFRGPKTYKGVKNPEKVFPLDAVFIPESWKQRIISSEVLHGEEWDSLSDHCPVIVKMS